MYSTRHDNLFFHQIGVCENLQSGDSLFLGFQIGCGFKSDVVSISYYCTTILHKCAMCYAKIKRGFFLTIVAQFQFLLYVLLPNYFP